MPLAHLYCKFCNKLTYQVEERVATGPTATVWHCLTCGKTHLPPDEDTDYHNTADIKPPVKPTPNDAFKVLV